MRINLRQVFVRHCEYVACFVKDIDTASIMAGYPAVMVQVHERAGKNWNERMCVETALSMVTVICDLKHIHHRVSAYIQARLASVMAMFNVLLTLFHRLHPDADPFQMSISEFSL